MNWNDAYVVNPPKKGEYLVKIGNQVTKAYFYPDDIEHKQSWIIDGADNIWPEYWSNINGIK